MTTLLITLLVVYVLGFVVTCSCVCWSLWGYGNRMLPHEWALVPALCTLWPWVACVALYKWWCKQ